jgi:hypothetical protein
MRRTRYPDLVFNPLYPMASWKANSPAKSRQAGFALDISDRGNTHDNSFHLEGRDWKTWE